MAVVRSILVSLILLALLALTLTGCETDSKQYLRIAKTTFERLTKNDPRAGEKIDWNNLVINDNEAGRGFSTLTTQYEKDNYKNATVANLSKYFAARGWNVTNVKNWRVEAQGVESALVIADAPNGKLTFGFQRVQLEKMIAKILTN